MKERIVTGVIAGALFLAIVILGNVYLSTLVFLIGTVALYELLRMKQISIFSVPGLVSVIFLWIMLLDGETLNELLPFSFEKTDAVLMTIFILLTVTVLTKNKFTFDDAGFVMLATLYAGAGFYYFIETRDAGLEYLFFVLFVIWATDSGAYFIGRKFGKRKLWPEISPKKTIEGALGGIASAVAVGIIFQIIVPVYASFFTIIAVAVLVAIFGQIGDLVESALKRHYGVKDSGKILPGHGGILDRFDSLLFVLPILHFLQLI